MKQTQTMYYEAPMLELFEVKAEQGFAASVVTGDIDYNGFGSETEL